MWFSVVCSLFDNDTRHHSDQNVADSRGAAGQVSPHQFWPLRWPVSWSIRVQTTLNHISICFLPQYQRQRKCFFQSARWKRHCETHWREQRCLDSYQQRQISQSDCEISSNCGKTEYWLGQVHPTFTASEEHNCFTKKQDCHFFPLILVLNLQVHHHNNINLGDDWFFFPSYEPFHLWGEANWRKIVLHGWWNRYNSRITKQSGCRSSPYQEGSLRTMVIQP